MLPLTKGATRCEEPTSSPEPCSATSRWRIACRRTIRCARSVDHRSRAGPHLAALRSAVRQFRSAVDCAGEAAARPAAAGVVHDPQRAAVDGATRLQPVVSLVRRASAWTTRSGRRLRLPRIAIVLLDGDIAAAFFEAVLIHADTARLLSDDHFTVDGTLLGGLGQSQELPAARSGSAGPRRG